MKKLYLKLLVFIAIVIILDQLIGTCLHQLYFKIYEGDFGGRINLAIENKSEILILGSSRAEHHYDPRIISDYTGLSVFNAGMDGQSIFYHYCIQQLIFEKHYPKLIVLEIWLEDLYLNGNSDLERLSVFLPYKKNAKVNEILKYRSPFEPIKFLSKIYSFNSKILGIIKFTLNKNAKDLKSRNGYSPLLGQVNDKLIKSATKRLTKKAHKMNTFDPLKVIIFKRIIECAIKNRIKLLLVESPSWYPDYIQKDNDQMEKEWSYIENILNSYKLDLYRFNEAVDAFRERVFFKDFAHLNETGSQIFSKEIGNKIKKYLNEGQLL